jgi:hypothetical protein
MEIIYHGCSCEVEQECVGFNPAHHVGQRHQFVSLFDQICYGHSVGLEAFDRRPDHDRRGVVILDRFGDNNVVVRWTDLGLDFLLLFNVLLENKCL